MLRTGVDMVEVSRIAETVEQYGSRFLQRVFTPAELKYAAGRVETLAARFAAKEAISKLLGVGIQHQLGVSWQEIEIPSSDNGEPGVSLRGRAAERARQLGLNEFSLSLSHTHEHAIAIVVAQ
jgi:holo-[acyl-carrier protein] synthase